MSSSAASSPLRTSFDTTEVQALPTLTNFLQDVPPQLTALLAELGPSIAIVRRLAEAASWRSEYVDSWLLLGVWWAVCLLSEFTLRYFFLVVAASVYIYLSATPPPKSRPPVTEKSLQATVIDLSVIEALTPSLPHPSHLPLNVVARVLAILYLPSLAILYFVPLKLVVGSCGTALFIWRARWAIAARGAIWRSAWVRRGLARAWALLSGQAAQPVVLATSLVHTPETGHSIRFLITVYENQRWWVGLDWTAALLPGERPSWCSTTLEPMSPPSAFTLPASTYAYVGDGKGGLVKRTASWSWEEGEWKVLVRKEMGVKRVEKELPAMKDDMSQHAMRVGKVKQKMHEAGQKLKPQGDSESKDVDEVEGAGTDAGDADPDMHEVDPDEQITDSDGWVYGDNKWKATSSSGGLGKYTRFRKWTRIALLTELVEPASAEEARAHASEVQESLTREKEDIDSSVSRRQLEGSEHSVDDKHDIDDDQERSGSGIRKRLKAAIRKTAASV